MNTADAIRTVGIVVAHPDDETLWAGWTLLLNPDWQCFIVSLCRASDPDRSKRFYRAIEQFHASGTMTDLNDGPEQYPLSQYLIQRTVLESFPAKEYDLLISHNPQGEYTRHKRHEEVGAAVCSLWLEQHIRARHFWLFAYDDNNKAHYPRAREDADLTMPLPPTIYEAKYRIVCDIYGFLPVSWEAQTCPAIEAFQCLHNHERWIKK